MDRNLMIETIVGNYIADLQDTFLYEQWTWQEMQNDIQNFKDSLKECSNDELKRYYL